MGITAKKSPNFNDRKGGGQPYMLIIHYTGMQTAQAAMDWMCAEESQVSAHYMIDEDGSTYQLVDDEKRAWHAGVSYWDGEMDINSASIGIELVNPGHEFGYRDFSQEQIEALKNLVNEKMKAFDISLYHVLGHSEVAPGRKQDPGHLFPWEGLAAQGIGLWPEVSDMDREAAKDLMDDETAQQQLLSAYGYNPQSPFADVVQAFYRHFVPESCSHERVPEHFCDVGLSRLLALVRAKNNLQT